MQLFVSVVADNVRDVQLAGDVRGYPGRTVAVRQRSYHRYCAGLRRRRLAHCAHLRGLRAAARHPASRPGRQRSDRLPDEGMPLTHRCRKRSHRGLQCIKYFRPC